MSAARRAAATRRAVLSHVGPRSRPTMVDVGDKPVTRRVAIAQARLRLPAPVAQALERTGLRTKKGPIINTAIVAGVMAAKRTAELIPFCHPLALQNVQLQVEFGAPRGRQRIGWMTLTCRVELDGKTGVEMEALTGVTVAALTIYDMCKALSHQIRIVDVRLLAKAGGRRAVGSLAGASRGR